MECLRFGLGIWNGIDFFKVEKGKKFNPIALQSVAYRRPFYFGYWPLLRLLRWPPF